MLPPPGRKHLCDTADLLQPHHDAVGGALGVHDGEAHEARPFVLDRTAVLLAVAVPSGTPFTSTVSGSEPPEIFRAMGSGLPPALAASSSRAPSGGNMIFKGGSPPALGRPAGRKRWSGNGSLPLTANRAPCGAWGSGAGSLPERAKASNRIGAAAVRPTRPGTGAPSGRPTQTPMVRLPSKPIDQASR